MDQTSPKLRDGGVVGQTFLSAATHGSAMADKNVCPTFYKEAVMAKFYVQSGNLEMVLQAKDSRSAASWAAHQTLSRSLPVLCEEPADYAHLADLTRLGETIRVSQRGFGRQD